MKSTKLRAFLNFNAFSSALMLSSCFVSPAWDQRVSNISIIPLAGDASFHDFRRVPVPPVIPEASPATYFPAAEPLMSLPVNEYRQAVQTAALRTTRAGPRRADRVVLRGKNAVAPSHAPPAVHRAVEAANSLQRFPYKWGGGHARLDDDGYDCSGAVSYVLREAGLMQGQMPSRGFFSYGESGEGEWITVWVRDGHVFMTIGGLRFDTGGSNRRTGPRWKPRVRNKKGLTARHPRGL